MCKNEQVRQILSTAWRFLRSIPCSRPTRSLCSRVLRTGAPSGVRYRNLAERMNFPVNTARTPHLMAQSVPGHDGCNVMSALTIATAYFRSTGVPSINRISMHTYSSDANRLFTCPSDENSLCIPAPVTRTVCPLTFLKRNRLGTKKRTTPSRM